MAPNQKQIVQLCLLVSMAVLFICVVVNMAKTFDQLKKLEDAGAAQIKLIDKFMKKTRAIHSVFFITCVLSAALAGFGMFARRMNLILIFAILTLVSWVVRMIVIFGKKRVEGDDYTFTGNLLQGKAYYLYHNDSEYAGLAFYPLTALIAFYMWYSETH